MKTEVNFKGRPYYGVFSELAKRMKLKGKHKRVYARSYYLSGNKQAVKLMNEIIKKRFEQYVESTEILQKAAEVQSSIQKSNSKGAK